MREVGYWEGVKMLCGGRGGVGRGLGGRGGSKEG